MFFTYLHFKTPMLPWHVSVLIDLFDPRHQFFYFSSLNKRPTSWSAMENWKIWNVYIIEKINTDGNYSRTCCHNYLFIDLFIYLAPRDVCSWTMPPNYWCANQCYRGVSGGIIHTSLLLLATLKVIFVSSIFLLNQVMAFVSMVSIQATTLVE